MVGWEGTFYYDFAQACEEHLDGECGTEEVGDIGPVYDEQQQQGSGLQSA